MPHRMPLKVMDWNWETEYKKLEKKFKKEQKESGLAAAWQIKRESYLMWLSGLDLKSAEVDERASQWWEKKAADESTKADACV